MQSLLASVAEISGDMVPLKPFVGFGEMKGAWAAFLMERTVLSCVFSIRIEV